VRGASRLCRCDLSPGSAHHHYSLASQGPVKFTNRVVPTRSRAGPLARKFDSDHLVLKAEGDEITIETPRSGWSLPIKLQTDATYSRHKETIVATPRGPQRASLVTASHAPMAVEIIKLGPSEGEFVTEHYVTTDDGNLEQQLTHRAADGRTEVVVRRVFKRVTSV